jgi:UTP:GlnB (protein PII) uridylyltransferase
VRNVQDCLNEAAKRRDGADSAAAKTLEMQQRHVKYEDTPYALEPNCKEAPAACATCRW